MSPQHPCRAHRLWPLLVLALSLIAQTYAPAAAQVSIPLVVAADNEPSAEVLITPTRRGYDVLSPTDSAVLHSGLDTIYRADLSSYFIVCSSSRWGLMDPNTGKFIIPTAYDIPPRRLSTAAEWAVTQDGKVGLYSLFIKPELTIPPSMDDINVVNYSMRRSLVDVTQGGLHGVYWTNGKELLPIAYTHIWGDSNYLFATETKGEKRKLTIISTVTQSKLDLDDVTRLTCTDYGGWLDPLGCVYLAERGQEQGILDEDAHWLIPLARQTITLSSDGRIIVTRGRKTKRYTLTDLLALSPTAQ